MIGYRYYHRRIRPYLDVPERKQYTILGMTLFSLVVFGAFAIRPSLYTIFRLNQEVREGRRAQEKLEQKINDLSQAQINYQLVAKDLELIDHALPKEAAVPQILESLALAAGRNSVVLSRTEFEEIEEDTALAAKVLPFTVEARGNFADIEKFIEELEDGIRQIDVGRVKITQGGEKLEFLIAEIEMKTFFK